MVFGLDQLLLDGGQNRVQLTLERIGTLSGECSPGSFLGLLRVVPDGQVVPERDRPRVVAHLQSGVDGTETL